jgi:hypothetical protein
MAIVLRGGKVVQWLSERGIDGPTSRRSFGSARVLRPCLPD